RNLVQPAASNPIDALLVFLHLLERDAELIGELGLRQSLGEALDPDVAANKSINGIRLFRRHDPISIVRSCTAAVRLLLTTYTISQPKVICVKKTSISLPERIRRPRWITT